MHLADRLNRIEDPGGERAITYSVPDVRSLCEQIGYVIGAASDFVADASEPQRALRDLAGNVGAGVPAEFRTLIDLQVDGLGREQIVRRLSEIGEERDLAKVIDALGLRPTIASEATRKLGISREVERDNYRSMPNRLADTMIRGTTERYQEQVSRLVSASTGQRAAEVLETLLALHGIDCYSGDVVEQQPSTGRVNVISDPVVTISLVLDSLDREDVAGLEASSTVIIPTDRPSDGARGVLAKSTASCTLSAGALCVFLAEISRDMSLDMTHAFASALGSQRGIVPISSVERLVSAAHAAR